MAQLSLSHHLFSWSLILYWCQRLLTVVCLIHVGYTGCFPSRLQIQIQDQFNFFAFLVRNLWASSYRYPCRKTTQTIIIFTYRVFVVHSTTYGRWLELDDLSGSLQPVPFCDSIETLMGVSNGRRREREGKGREEGRWPLFLFGNLIHFYLFIFLSALRLESWWFCTPARALCSLFLCLYIS